MPRGGATPRRPAPMPRAAGWVRRAIVTGAALLSVAATPTPSPRPVPTRSPSVRRLVVLMMTNPTEKRDTYPDRIEYVLRTGDFKVPTEFGGTVNQKVPSTYVLQRASVALIDNYPFALTPEQLGPEDFLGVQVYSSQSDHLHWSIRDDGVKGPGPVTTKEPIPFFNRDKNEIYRDYLERILAALQLSSKGTR